MTDHHDPDHDRPDLLGLLTGELDRDETVAAARHLETCQDCTRELVELTVAHAALRSSVRVDRILGEQPEPSGAEPPADLRDAEPLPPLPAEPEETAAAIPEGSVERARRGAPGRGWWRWAAAAVVASILVTTAAVAMVARRGTPTSPVVSAPLHAVGGPARASGSVAVFAQGSTRTLRVAARQLPAPAAHDFYEVWLLDPATQKMLAMGVLSPTGRGQYSVSADIMGGYSAVDISLQANDGNPAHSDTSVLRAFL